MNIRKNIYKLFILLFFLVFPLSILAYSDYIIASGENVGIKLNSEGIIIVGTYNINGENIIKKSGLEIGDIITKIDETKVNNIDNMIDILNNKKNDTINITYKRNNQYKTTTLKFYRENNEIKTGLYLKDSITGIGTLTYVDPKTKIFGALGHEIIDSTTDEIFKIKDGTIFKSKVTGIVKSDTGNPGEKNATYDINKVTGNINENTIKGIFGKYTDNINLNNLYKVAKEDEIKLGQAKIKTVLKDSEISEYDINIIKINKTKDNVKNIIFEIVDDELLSKTNGIIQGMSGSPIIQDDKIIGAVTHVIVENPKKGYGIFITNMLEEGEN